MGWRKSTGGEMVEIGGIWGTAWELSGICVGDPRRIWSLNWPSHVARQASTGLGTGLHSVELLAERVPKQPRLILGQRVAFHKPTVGSHYGGQHLHSSLNMERLSQCLLGAFSPTS